MKLCGLDDPPTCWEDVIEEGMQHWRKKILKAYVCRLALGSTVYHIWKNRNELKHGTHPLSEDHIIQRIKWEVRSGVISKGSFKKTRGNETICCRWRIDIRILV
ncbi:hypothetical protein SLA2020_261960 [Shorea laevis]